MRQWQRYGEHGPRSNADLQGGAVARHCRPDADGRRLLTQAVQAFGLSARGYARVLKVARTIADLGGSDSVRVRRRRGGVAIQIGAVTGRVRKAVMTDAGNGV
jgi:magnesium chelatase family protein